MDVVTLALAKSYTNINSANMQTQIDSTNAQVALKANQFEDVKEKVNNLGFKRINLFNKNSNEILIDKYSADSNGNVVGENIFTSSFRTALGYLVTNTFEVSPGDVVRSNGNFYLGSGVYADKNGVIIGRLANVTTSANYANLLTGWTVPSGVKYVRLIVAYNTMSINEVKDALIITINRDIPSEYFQFENIKSENIVIDYSQIKNIPVEPRENQWTGKKAGSLGSSLSQMGGWDSILKSALGLSAFYNRGSGSTSLADLSSYGIYGYPTERYVYTDTSGYDESNKSVFGLSTDTGITTINSWYSSDDRIGLLPTDLDLVLIDLATNDAFYSIKNLTLIDWTTFMASQSFGDIWNAPTLDNTKFEGAFYTMIKKVQTRCPNARVVVWGMLINNLFTTQNSYLDKYMQMYSRISELCRKTGVIFVDTMMLEGANVFNVKSEYHTDYVHPATTDVAIRGVANAIIGTLKNIYPKNYLHS